MNRIVNSALSLYLHFVRLFVAGMVVAAHAFGSGDSRNSTCSSGKWIAVNKQDRRQIFWLCLVLFVAAGFLLRACLAIHWPTVQRQDEVFQNLEPAHRLLTGWGVVTWEWREAMRSWLFPGFIAGLLWTSNAVGLANDAAFPFVWTVFSAIAAGVIAIGTNLGWQKSRITGAVMCGTLLAFWPDLNYLSPKTLVEVQGGNLALIAAALASFSSEGRRQSSLIAAIGVLLSLAFAIRFQLVPALGLVSLWTARASFRKWSILLLGAVPILVGAGVLDWWTLGSPFQSIWKNIAINLVSGKADEYGVQPIHWYAATLAHRYGAAVVPLVVFFCLGAFRVPLLAVFAIVIVGSHSLIAHKELSFVYAALPAAMLTTALGTAWVIDELATVLRRSMRQQMLIAASLAWIATCALTGYASEPFKQSGKPTSALWTLWTRVRSQPDLCGLGLDIGRTEWAWTPGYAGLNRSVPILALNDRIDLARGEGGANYIIARTDKAGTLTGYQTTACSGEYCLLHREQNCAPVPELEISAVLTHTGQ